MSNVKTRITATIVEVVRAYDVPTRLGDDDRDALTVDEGALTMGHILQLVDANADRKWLAALFGALRADGQAIVTVRVDVEEP